MEEYEKRTEEISASEKKARGATLGFIAQSRTSDYISTSSNHTPRNCELARSVSFPLNGKDSSRRTIDHISTANRPPQVSRFFKYLWAGHVVIQTPLGLARSLTIQLMRRTLDVAEFKCGLLVPRLV
ncbi:hypothetical protein PFISCL1PPCAC_24683, partial [Pristionchus fissidentatus]